MGSSDLISLVDALMVSKTFIEVPNTKKKRLCDVMGPGPRPCGFKARLCNLLAV